MIPIHDHTHHYKLVISHWALGIGHWALGIIYKGQMTNDNPHEFN
ncbi:hypothetical protein [uncultured Nostoc sp.]